MRTRTPAAVGTLPAAGLLLLTLLLATPSAVAQTPSDTAAARAAAASDTAGAPELTYRCDGAIVSSVEVGTHRPDYSGRTDRWWRRAARSIGLRHHTTAAPIVRRFVSLEVGQPCTEFRRSESERVLRAQPYLSSAAVRTVDDGAGGVRVLVETVDEVPAIVGMRFRRNTISAIRLGNENIFGRAIHAEVRAEQGFAFRDGFGGRLQHNQLFGRPYTLAIVGEKRPAGHWSVVEAGHPFITDLQRIAWHAGTSESHDYMGLLRHRHGDDEPIPTLSVRRRAWDVGGVFRFGPPGRLGLLGGAFTGERSDPEPRPVYFTDSAIVQMPDDVPPLNYPTTRAVRATVVAGFRMLQFTTVHGYDALSGEQDLASGVQLGVVAGRALTALGSREEDFVAAADLYAGRHSGRSYFALRLEAEGRQGLGTSRWDGVMGGGRAAWYYKQAPLFTFIAEVTGAGAWEPRLPVALSLGEHHGVGIRGFGAAHETGERVLSGHIEQRWNAGPVRGRGEVGVALFADAGRLWAGSSPYGETSPVGAAVGISLLAAVPLGAQRLWRADLAFPVHGDAGRRWEVRFGSTHPLHGFWEEPSEVSRARSLAGPVRVFSWP